MQILQRPDGKCITRTNYGVYPDLGRHAAAAGTVLARRSAVRPRIARMGRFAGSMAIGGGGDSSEKKRQI